jgi:hypothetical protein
MSARAPPCLMLFPSTTSVRSAALRRTPVASSIAPVPFMCTCASERCSILADLSACKVNAACPVSTGVGTRRVRLLRGGGRGERL